MERFLPSIFGFPVESGKRLLLFPGRRRRGGIGKLTFCLMLFRDDVYKELRNTEPAPFESKKARNGNRNCELGSVMRVEL